MMEAEALVYVVDDDASLRASLQDLLSPWGCGSRPARRRRTSCAARARRGPAAWCSMCGCRASAGWSLQQRLTAGDLTLPIIFITGHGDIPMSVQASPCGCLTSDTWTSYPGLEEEVDGNIIDHRRRDVRIAGFQSTRDS